MSLFGHPAQQRHLPQIHAQPSHSLSGVGGAAPHSESLQQLLPVTGSHASTLSGSQQPLSPPLVMPARVSPQVPSDGGVCLSGAVVMGSASMQLHSAAFSSSAHPQSLFAHVSGQHQQEVPQHQQPGEGGVQPLIGLLPGVVEVEPVRSSGAAPDSDAEGPLEAVQLKHELTAKRLLDPGASGCGAGHGLPAVASGWLPHRSGC